MNRNLIKEANFLPVQILEMFAEKCGVDWSDTNGLLELQAIILEEIIDKDVDEPNIFSAFKSVQDSVSRRWSEWMQESVSCAYDV